MAKDAKKKVKEIKQMAKIVIISKNNEGGISTSRSTLLYDEALKKAKEIYK